MHDLTTYELDVELAEQLPARQLMGGSLQRTSNVAVAGNSSDAFINGGNGNQIQALTLFSSNGNAACAG